MEQSIFNNIWKILSSALDVLHKRTDVELALHEESSLIAQAERITRGMSGLDIPLDEKPEYLLECIFNRMYADAGKGMFWYPLSMLENKVPEMLTSGSIAPDHARKAYQQLADGFENKLSQIKQDQANLPGLLNTLERYTTYVPAYGAPGVDISLYEARKMTAALYSCLQLKRDALQKEGKDLPQDEGVLLAEPFFLVFRCELSGIQPFLYRIRSANALKSLRSRSFMISFIVEHLADELLEACGLSRANLIYAGGGGCYVLLPNTKQAVQAVNEVETAFNQWFLEMFGVSLYAGCASTPVCANALMNKPTDSGTYAQVFTDLFLDLTQKKLRRYSPEQIIALNNRQESGTRECVVCGVSTRLKQVEKNGHEESICDWCELMESASPALLSSDVTVFILSGSQSAHGKGIGLPTAGNQKRFMQITERQLADDPQGFVRAYVKNRYPQKANRIRLFMGDYCAKPTIDELVRPAGAEQKTDRPARAAVFRADVDNLGAAFVHGFASRDGEKDRYLSLLRTAAFSRRMGLFFQLHINALLSKPENNRALQTAVIYSGGDDLFLLGRFDDTLACARRLVDAFASFSAQRLTFSGGVALMPPHYPLHRMAMESAELESDAKALPGKNGVSLFEPHVHLYAWQEFFAAVQDDKQRTIEDFMRMQDEKQKAIEDFMRMQDEKGQSFLMQLRGNLLGMGNTTTIHLARCAYLLARMLPSDRNSNYDSCKRFADKIMQWLIHPKERGQLLTAIDCYFYIKRYCRLK